MDTGLQAGLRKTIWCGLQAGGLLGLPGPFRHVDHRAVFHAVGYAGFSPSPLPILPLALYFSIFRPS